MRELFRAVFANPWLKLLSVLLAAAVWLYVQSAEIEESRISAQLVWSLPNQLVPVTPPPTTVTLVVKGTRAETRAARSGTIRMVVDVSDRVRGSSQVDLAMFPVEGLPKTVERAGVAPAMVELVLDDLVRRKLKLRSVVVGEPATGFAVTTVELEPARVEVSGPRVVIDGLTEVSTRPIDINGLAVTTMRPIELDLPPGVSQPEDLALAARIELTSRIERREIAEVPVFVRGPSSYGATPQRVSVSFEGPAPALAAMDAAAAAVFVVLPPDADKQRYEAWLGPRDGVRVEVLHRAGEGVKVTAIAPPSIVLEAP